MAVQSPLSNTLTHGIPWGVIPLLLLVPALHGRGAAAWPSPLGERQPSPASAAE